MFTIRRDDTLDCVTIGHVEYPPVRTAAGPYDLGNDGVDPILVEIGDRDVCSFIDEYMRRGATHPACSARDQRDVVLDRTRESAQARHQ